MARTTTTERGYGTAHQRERRRWDRILEHDGPLACMCDCRTRGHDDCGTFINHNDTWDLGHTDDRTAWTGPECVPCNRGTGGRNGAAVTNAKRQMTIREW